MRIQTIFGLALVVSSVQPLTGQPSPVTLSGTEEHALHSRILDRDFELYVKLPWSYHQTAEPYPVLFTLDANRTFPLFATISSIFETPGGGGAREVVVVGIAYKTRNDRLEGLVDWATLRQRDFEPEANPEADSALKARLSALPGQGDVDVRSGEADAFLEFLQQEAIPFVEEHYRVSATERSLAGYSLSGLFVLYAFFKAPATFSTYLAGDPSMRDILFRLEADRKAFDPGPEARILIVTPEGRGAVTRLVDRLRSHGNPGLNVHHEVLPDEDHLSGGPAAISRMLRIVHGLMPIGEPSTVHPVADLQQEDVGGVGREEAVEVVPEAQGPGPDAVLPGVAPHQEKGGSGPVLPPEHGVGVDLPDIEVGVAESEVRRGAGAIHHVPASPGIQAQRFGPQEGEALPEGPSPGIHHGAEVPVQAGGEEGLPVEIQGETSGRR